MMAKRFTVYGGFSGKVYAADVSMTVALAAFGGEANESRLPILDALLVGQGWESHPGQALGIKVRRIA